MVKLAVALCDEDMVRVGVSVIEPVCAPLEDPVRLEVCDSVGDLVWLGVGEHATFFAAMCTAPYCDSGIHDAVSFILLIARTAFPKPDVGLYGTRMPAGANQATGWSV